MRSFPGISPPTDNLQEYVQGLIGDESEHALLAAITGKAAWALLARSYSVTDFHTVFAFTANCVDVEKSGIRVAWYCESMLTAVQT